MAEVMTYDSYLNTVSTVRFKTALHRPARSENSQHHVEWLRTVLCGGWCLHMAAKHSYRCMPEQNNKTMGRVKVGRIWESRMSRGMCSKF